jgi:hypothetical protein
VSAQQRALRRCLAVWRPVRRSFPSVMGRSIMAEIYLCHACSSCPEILRVQTPGQAGAAQLRACARWHTHARRTIQLRRCAAAVAEASQRRLLRRALRGALAAAARAPRWRAARLRHHLRGWQVR